MPQGTTRVVVTDANVLINLIHADALSVLARIGGYEFIVVDDVVAEITIAEQVTALQTAIADGSLRCESLTDITTLTLFADLRAIMGRGEAASLALAVTNNLDIACDEKKVFRREAMARLGHNRILTTPGILVLAIRAGVITVEKADQMKDILATKRFIMTFSSFKDVL